MLSGKKGVVLNIANKYSIGWGIAQTAFNHGAEIVLGIQSDRFRKPVTKLAEEIKSSLVAVCDVTRDEDIDALSSLLQKEYTQLDFLVHSIAYTPTNTLKEPLVETSRQDYKVALDISAYSFIALARALAPLMKDGGSILCMSYYGAEKVVPNYNVMGVAKAALESSVRYLANDLGPKQIRVNALSAGPISTLAARGIPGFTDMKKVHAQKAPLRRNVEMDEVGQTASFLLSELSSGITGEVVYVDCGYHILGM